MTSARMQTEQPEPTTQRLRQPAPPLTQHAMLGWAAVLALALLSYFVHVLNEHVQRGESRHQQWRMPARSTSGAPTAQMQMLSKADIGYSRELASGR